MVRLLSLALLAAVLTATNPVAAQPVVKFGAAYTADALAAVDGGLDDGADVVGRADLWADLEGASIGLPQVSAHLDLIAVHGPDFSGRRTGVYQTISSLEADAVPHVYEAWVKWQVNPALSAKAGLIDLNAEFDVQPTGALFLNSAFGIGPDISQSGPAGPSIFPMTASAVMIRAQSGRKGFALGVFDAQAGSLDDPRKPALRFPGTTGALIIAEAKLPIGAWLLQLGGWHFTKQYDDLDPSKPRASSHGIYAMAEGALTTKVSTWLRVGLVDSHANPIGVYVGGGAVAELEDWRLGFAAAHARLGSTARRNLHNPGPARKAETVIELSAQHAVTSWFQVQPDLQYVIHPGWDRTLPNALVLGLRVSFVYSQE